MLLVCNLNVVCAFVLVISFGFFLWALGVTLFSLMKVAHQPTPGLKNQWRFQIFEAQLTVWNSQPTALYWEYLV
jgi:hypothetical protein